MCAFFVCCEVLVSHPLKYLTAELDTEGGASLFDYNCLTSAHGSAGEPLIRCENPVRRITSGTCMALQAATGWQAQQLGTGETCGQLRGFRGRTAHNAPRTTPSIANGTEASTNGLVGCASIGLHTSVGLPLCHSASK